MSVMHEKRRVGAREANQSFARLLREAEAGIEITITRNGRPVAVLSACSGAADDPTAARDLAEMRALMSRGLTRPGHGLRGRRSTRDEMAAR